MRGKKIVRKEDQSKTCTICGKIFVNGKALGGHLRSHYAKLPLTPDSDRDPDLGKKPADSPPAEGATRRRSSRARVAGSGRSGGGGEDSRSFSEEYGAECLMMLSRDSWERKSGTPQVTVRPEDMYVSSSRNDVVGGHRHKEVCVSSSRNDRSFCRGGKGKAYGFEVYGEASRNDGSFYGGGKTTAYGEVEAGEYCGYECEICKQVFESRERHVCSGDGKRYSSAAGGSMIDLNRLPALQLEDGGDDGLTEEDVSSTEEDE